MRNILKGRRKVRKNDSKAPLIEHNNNVQDGYDQEGIVFDSPVEPNTFNTHKEQRPSWCKKRLMPQELAEHLGVALDAASILFEDGSWCAFRPEPNSGEHNLKPDVDCLIKRSVSEHFPKPQQHLDQNLQHHLQNVQDVVLHELKRLGPLLESRGLMERLIDCYHRQIFHHLHSLLRNVTSAQSSFVMMNWVLHKYLSKELLGHPDLQELDPINKVNVRLLEEWVNEAQDKLLENVQKEVRGSLEKILQNEMSQERCNSEETYVGFYVDTIQCIDSMHSKAQKISPELCDQVQKVCFQELLEFVKRYTTEQTEALEKKAKMDKPETTHFLKTLKTCKELKQYVQNKGINTSLLKEMMRTLENMEASTLKLLMDIVTDMAESHFKKYFKSDHRRSSFTVIEKYFPKLAYGVDEQKTVMDETYKVVVRTYVKLLIQSNQKKLKRCWSPDVEQTVSEDADLLHNTISDLAPDVQQWNLLLLVVTDILECNSIDALKITVAAMQKQPLTKTEDTELLPKLLRWKGLSKREVKEVLEALPTDLQPRPDPDHEPTRCWYFCFPCLRCG